MSNVENNKLSDFCEITSSKRIYASEYKGFGVPFYRGKEIIEKQKGSLDVSTEIFISEEKYQQIKEKYDVPKEGELLLSSVGTLGVPYVIKKGERFYFKDGNLLWFKNFSYLNSQYLYYWFLSPQGEAQLKRSTIGSSQSAFTISLLKEVEIDPPDLEIQQKVVSILSAFDDLIENNTRRIAILEEMAQLIYREWFVYYRYPGREEDELVDSGTEFGEVPEGWGVKKLEDLCELIVGQSPKSEFYNDIGEGLPFHQGVKDFGNRFPKTTTWCTVQKRIAEEGDILFSVRAPVGRINIANCKMIIGRGLHAIRSKTDNQVFIFEQLKDKFQEEDSMGSGTIYKSVTKGDMLNLKLIYPGSDLIAKFEEKVNPIFNQVRTLTEKNVYLKETRDLLLPRLISGKVNIEGI